MKRFASVWISMLAMTASLFAGALLFSGTASAQTPSCYPGCSTTVTPQVSNNYAATAPVANENAPESSTSASAPSASQASSGNLAFTGVDAAGTAVVALLLIGGGLVVLRVGRRRHHV